MVQLQVAKVKRSSFQIVASFSLHQTYRARYKMVAIFDNVLKYMSNFTEVPNLQ